MPEFLPRLDLNVGINTDSFVAVGGIIVSAPWDHHILIARRSAAEAKEFAHSKSLRSPYLFRGSHSLLSLSSMFVA